ncbi:hypothetical protein SCAR479_11917 [Seiridium cardinale]|uniref:Uncharacterized protein n=1 Tax=Seiridium cardinale TaxID=138064 RepID=A0ABR2XCA3_9PEZI
MCIHILASVLPITATSPFGWGILDAIAFAAAITAAFAAAITAAFAAAITAAFAAAALWHFDVVASSGLVRKDLLIQIYEEAGFVFVDEIWLIV